MTSPLMHTGYCLLYQKHRAIIFRIHGSLQPFSQPAQLRVAQILNQSKPAYEK
jgi:hypothetical protein